MQLSTAFRNEANMTTETPENTTPEGSGHTTDGSGLVALLTQPVCKHCGKPVRMLPHTRIWAHLSSILYCDMSGSGNWNKAQPVHPADVDDAVARAQSLYPPQFTLMLSVADSDDDRENLVRAFLLGAKHVNAELAPMWPEYVRQTVDAFLGTGEELSL
jgi:hypothetical protein